MIKAEVSEIKKLFSIKDCSITRISGCYVNGDRAIVNTWQQPFLSMDEEDIYKYLEIFKQCLGGTLNKSLFNIRPNQGACDKLAKLTKSGLKNEKMLLELYEHIIDNYEYVGNYIIIAIHDAYDIPKKASDGTEMEDASEEVYEYILTCICPVNLSKPGLGYDRQKRIFTHIERGWVMGGPEIALLYPAFNDRSGDAESALYFAKSMDSEKQDFATRTMGAVIEYTPAVEKDIFRTVIEETLGYDKTMQDIWAVNDLTRGLAEERKYEPEQGKVGIEDIRKLLKAAGIKAEKLDNLDTIYTDVAGSCKSEISLANIVNRRSFTVKTGYGTITTKPEHADAVNVRYIDGKPYLTLDLEGDVIEVDGMEVGVQDADI